MEKDSKYLKTTLIQLLQEELVRARALLLSLRNESKALSSLDEKLVFINSVNKQKLIESLQLASNARIDFMSKHDLSSAPAVIEEYTISSESDTELDTLFIQLSELAEKCFDENRAIGQLINRRTQFITQTLSSLSPSADMHQLTYGETGSIAAEDYSRTSLFHLTKI